MRWANFIIAGLIAMVLAGCQSAPELASLPPPPLPSSPMPGGQPAQDPPPGFVSFCMRYADQCLSDAKEASTVALTPDLWKTLNVVNETINYAIVPASDEVQYGRGEYWTIPKDGYGNCHDYMVAKRQALARAGVPLRALRMAIVLTPHNERHAILTVATDQGDYVLDNLRQDILPWDRTGYAWISRQDDRNDWGWIALDGGPTRVADAEGPRPAVN